MEWNFPNYRQWGGGSSVWSKTVQITGSVGGLGNPTCWKYRKILMSLTLTGPIFKNFQSNGALWQTLKLWNIYIIINNTVTFFQSLRDWKFLKIGSVSFRDIIKNISFLQVGPAIPTPPVIRVVLLHTELGAGVINFWRQYIYLVNNIYLNLRLVQRINRIKYHHKG